jgi:thiol-disulfide isomerase/thioredoxin
MRKLIFLLMIIFAMSAFDWCIAQEKVSGAEKGVTQEKPSLSNEPQTLTETLAAIKKLRNELLSQNKDAMKEAEDYDKLVGQKVIERAREYTLRFPLDKTPSADLMNLARLYIEADQCETVASIVARRLSEPSLSETGRADLLLESIDVAMTGRASKSCKDIITVVDNAVGQLDAMGDGFLLKQITAYRSAVNFYSRDENKLEKAAKRYIELYKKLTPADRSDNWRFGVYKAYTSLAGIYAAHGENDRVKATFGEGVELLSPDPGAASTLSILKYDLGRYELPGQKAVPIEAEYWINRKSDIKPLSLTGKVTLIEFTAHWCVPCKETYPALMKMHKNYAKRGLDILLVTSLYGYFGKERNLTPEQEVANDKKYFTEEWKLPFKVAVKTPFQAGSGGPGSDKNSRAYFSQAIPQFVLIDRKGTIRYVTTAWGPKIETQLTKVIEDLLKESKN